MGLKALISFIVLLLSVNIVYAATIHGNIYDIYLDKKANTIATINTVPKQNYISKDGYYEFKVPIGNYEITAEYYEYNELKYSATEQISIKEEGDYTVDIILFPSFEEDQELIEETSQINLEKNTKEKLIRIGIFIIYGVIAILLISLIAGLIYFYKRKKKKKEKEITPDTADKVIEFIKSQDGRTTQKDIRKNFDLSEAKISLIISELEKKGTIKKIKKGRGNIIILQK